MRKEIKDVLYLIGLGLALAFTLITYAHSTFTTKEVVEKLEQNTKEKMESVHDDVKIMQADIKKLLERK